MSRFRRGLLIATVACGVAAGTTGTAMAQPASGPTITIGAKSKIAPVSHYTLVVYGVSQNGYNRVTIKGSISGAHKGDVAKLYAQQFPFNKAMAPVAGQTLKLSGATASYHFTGKPTLATRFTVKLFASSSATSPLATSPIKAVYVVSDQAASYKNCTQQDRPVCHMTVKLYTHLPASAYRTEVAKKLYWYFGVTLSKSGVPAPPKWLNLDPHATITKPKRISGTEFEETIKWSFRVGNDGYYPLFGFCTKNTETKDGLNLPGHHSCGAKRVRSTIAYLG